MNRHSRRAKQHHMRQIAKLPPGTVTELMVWHDEWCRVHSGGDCNCEPEYTVHQDGDITVVDRDGVSKVRPS